MKLFLAMPDPQGIKELKKAHGILGVILSLENLCSFFCLDGAISPDETFPWSSSTQNYKNNRTKQN